MFSNKDEKQVEPLQTLQRSINVLKSFSMESKEMTLTEISNKNRLAKSTISRILSTLEMNGFLERNNTNMKYRLGKHIYLMGQLAEESIEIKNIAEPIMNKLRLNTNETISLFMIEDDCRTCIQSYSSLHSIKHVIEIGDKEHLTIGAAGKVILAFQPEDFLKKVIETVPNTNKKIEKDLLNIKEDFSVISTGERGTNVMGIASPIFNIHNEVNYCLHLSGPRTRFQKKDLIRFQKEVKNHALDISAELGYNNEITSKF